VKLSKRSLIALLGLLVLLLGASQLLSGRSNGASFTETEFRTELDAGQIKSVNFDYDARKATGELKAPIATGKFRGEKTFTATYRTESEEALVNLADAKNVTVSASAKKDPEWISFIPMAFFLVSAIIVVLVARLLTWLFRKFRRSL
jgi:ATP-dependent Zn protease